MASNRSVRNAPFRAANELSAPDDDVERLRAEADRWRRAARRMAEEVGAEVRAGAERMERQAAELSQALDKARAELAAGRARLRALESAQQETLKALAEAQARAAALAGEAERAAAARLAMSRTLSWRATAPLRAFGAGAQTFFREGARLRRRMLKRVKDR